MNLNRTKGMFISVSNFVLYLYMTFIWIYFLLYNMETNAYNQLFISNALLCHGAMSSVFGRVLLCLLVPLAWDSLRSPLLFKHLQDWLGSVRVLSKLNMSSVLGRSVRVTELFVQADDELLHLDLRRHALQSFLLYRGCHGVDLALHVGETVGQLPLLTKAILHFTQLVLKLSLPPFLKLQSVLQLLDSCLWIRGEFTLEVLNELSIEHLFALSLSGGLWVRRNGERSLKFVVMNDGTLTFLVWSFALISDPS